MAEFRLLGLVEVRSDGRPVPVGQPRQRLVLAALLVDAGRPVTPEALIYRVWGDVIPDGARHALHEYLTRVRRLLAQVADGSDAAVLSRRGGVYVLDVDKDQVDLHVFRRLIERARLAGCPDEDRRACLDQALRLWRGEPLADLSGPWVEQIRDNARRLRVEATILLAQASSRLGRVNETVEPLLELAAENPLAEPVVAELMRALHATGRTMDALDCYTAIRKRLVEDLGTDPSQELQALHRMMLQGVREPGPGLDLPPPDSPQPAAAVPAQLPAAVRGFAGRVDQLTRLDELLAEVSSGVAVSAVSGTAGVGKTALAVHWAHRVAGRFPDGQLYVNLGGFDGSDPMVPSDALRGFLDALGVPPHRIPFGLAGQAALYRSTLAGRRVLVVLDNARDPDQVRPLLPSTPGCLALVTSRNQLTGLVAVDGALPLTLDTMSTVEAKELLTRRLGAARVEADPEAVLAVIDACARLPLALAIISARAQQIGFPLSHLAQELATSRTRLDALDVGDPASQVRAVFSWSYAALAPASARLFRLLGLHPGQNISTAAVASLAGSSPPEAREQLTDLTRANLVAEYSPGRFTFHDLLRSYAADLTDRIDAAADRRAATTRLLDHYLHTTHAAAMMLNPARDPTGGPQTAPAPGVNAERPADREQAMTWLETEHAVLLAAIRWSAQEGFDTHTWQLAYSLDAFHFLRGRWTDQITVWRTALLAGRRLDDLTAQSRAQHAVGVAANLLERDAEADEALRAALSLAIAAGDRAAQAGVHRSLSVLMERLNRPEPALDHDRQALALYRAAGDLRGEASALNAVGWDLVVLGDHAGAVDICERAVAVYEQVGDRHGEASAWDSLGYAEHHLGNHARAVTCYRRAVDTFSDIGDHYNHAGSLTRLGDAHQALNEQETARAVWRQALDLLTDLGHPDAAAVRTKLGH